jgi:Ca2+/Na+ antiporter
MMDFIYLILGFILLFMTWKNRKTIIQKKGRGVFFVAIAFWCLCIAVLFLPKQSTEESEQTKERGAQVADARNTAAPIQEKQVNSGQVKETIAKPAEEKDELLPANPDETKKLKEHVDFLRKTYGDLKTRYNQQKNHYDPLAWASYTKEVRAKIDSKRSEFNGQFPVGKVSGGNIENVFSINDLYISMYTDVIKTMWDNLEGSKSDEEVKLVTDKTDQAFKKIKFQ